MVKRGTRHGGVGDRRSSDADRRGARRGRVGRTVRQHQPGHRRRSSARSPTRGVADMERAIAAARRAFDETDWATDPRAAQARASASSTRRSTKEREDAAPADRRRGRHADHAHVRGADGQLHRRHGVGHRVHRPVSSGSTTSPIHEFFGMRSAPAGRAGSRSAWSARSRRGTSRSCSTSRRSCPRSRPATRVILKPAPTRRGARRASASSSAEDTDIPAGRVQRRHVERPGGRRRRADRRRRDVDMISFTGSTAVGKRIMAQRLGHAEAGVPRARRQVGEHRPRRRRLPGADAAAARWSACTAARGARSRPACSCPARATTKASSSLKAGVRRRGPTATRPTPANLAGPAHQRPPARARARAHREGQGRGRPVPRRRRARRRSSTRATTCSRRCSSTSTPTRRSRRRRSSARCSSVIPYEDDDDAVRIANNSRYGLSGAVNGDGPRPCVRRRQAHPDGHGRGQRRPVVRPRLAVRWLQGERASGASTASPASRSTSRPRPSASRRRTSGRSASSRRTPSSRTAVSSPSGRSRSSVASRPRTRSRRAARAAPSGRRGG